MIEAPATPKRSQHSDLHNAAILATPPPPPPTTPYTPTPNTDGIITNRRKLLNAALLTPPSLHRTSIILKNNKRRATEFIDRSRIRMKNRRSARRARRKKKQKPIKRSAWLIPADHPFKILWDVLTIIVSIFGGYLNTHSSIRDRNYEQRPFVVFTEVWFLIDILLNFVTEHKTSDGHVIQDGKAVWARYLTSWFAIDVLSLIPWERHYVKPIVEVQKKRGFFKKSFFRTKAVVRVTRVLRGRHLKLFGRVAKQTKQVGVGGQRLLTLIIKYFPRYRLFFRNMKGVLALRMLRQIHWIRKVIKGLCVKPRRVGGALAHRVRRRRQRLREKRMLASSSSITNKSSFEGEIRELSQQDDCSLLSFYDDDLSSQEGGRDYYSDASYGHEDDISDTGTITDDDDDDSVIRRLYVQKPPVINRAYSDSMEPSRSGTDLRFCRSESTDSLDSFDDFWDKRQSSPDRVLKRTNTAVIRLPPRSPPRYNYSNGKKLFSSSQVEEIQYDGKVSNVVCMESSSIAVGKFKDDDSHKSDAKDDDNKLNDNIDIVEVTKKTDEDDDLQLVDVVIFSFICCMFAYIGFGMKGIHVYVD